MTFLTFPALCDSIGSMRDYHLIRGLNPKKTPLLPLAQYCAAAELADEEMKKALPKAGEALGVFLAYRLLSLSEGGSGGEEEIFSETPLSSRTLSELIYTGLADADGRLRMEPLHGEAENFIREALKKLLRTLAESAFAAGCRAGFNRPGELADHLRDDIGISLSAPLEVLLPAECWQWTVGKIREKYGAEAELIRAERKRFRRDYDAAKAKKEKDLTERAAALPYEGEPGKYYSQENNREFQQLKEKYSAEEIGLLLFGGKIRLSSAFRKDYYISRDPQLDKKLYHTELIPDWHPEKGAAAFRTLAKAYEESIRAEREEAAAEEGGRRQERNRKRRRNAAVRTAIVNSIPDNYIDLFPLARAMKRHFVLHIGPTNSGKTHDAIEALKQAENGIYLGPLRLLAFEQYEALNEAGCPCSLVTGEERIEDPWACYQASTIEMLNTRTEYALAVIDEAQMIGDPDRGGAWTSAILGVCAKEVHVCAAPIARKLLIRLIRDCGDSYTVVEHRRMTPLKLEKDPFTLEEDVQPGDALIVFSKKSVHAVGAYLQRHGFRCSVIYGALPYDVRREQARLFARGENEVVVATDAIGMGMNLPIRRVIFLEQEKYDGISVRPLLTEEIKQIAGRAGRYGIYPEGLVNSTEPKSPIRAGLEGKSETVREAVIAFPESLLGVDAPLSEIIERWGQLEIKPGYTRADSGRMLKLCRMIEPLSEDKSFLYDCISMTFDEEETELLSVWRVMCAKEAAGEVYDVENALPDGKKIEDSDNMNELEEAFRLCDLLFGYCEKFDHTEWREEIMHRKNRISAKMTEILARQSLHGRRCAACGKAMPWNVPYGLCERCYKLGRGRMLNLPADATRRIRSSRGEDRSQKGRY